MYISEAFMIDKAESGSGANKETREKDPATDPGEALGKTVRVCSDLLPLDEDVSNDFARTFLHYSFRSGVVSKQ